MPLQRIDEAGEYTESKRRVRSKASTSSPQRNRAYGAKVSSSKSRSKTRSKSSHRKVPARKKDSFDFNNEATYGVAYANYGQASQSNAYTGQTMGDTMNPYNHADYAMPAHFEEGFAQSMGGPALR